MATERQRKGEGGRQRDAFGERRFPPGFSGVGMTGLGDGSRELLMFVWQELADKQKILYFLETILQFEVNGLFYFLKHI